MDERCFSTYVLTLTHELASPIVNCDMGKSFGNRRLRWPRPSQA